MAKLPEIYIAEGEAQKKEPFKFEYTVPSLDWFDIVKVELQPDDYYYFKLERRYGPSWWLIGKNPPAAGATDYRWTEKSLGQISDGDLVRFVEWAKCDFGGSRIIEIAAISGSFDILRETERLLGVVNKVQQREGGGFGG